MAAHPPLTRTDMEILDRWDAKPPGPARHQHIAQVIRALHTAWLAPLGVTLAPASPDARAGFLLRHPAAARAHARATDQCEVTVRASPSAVRICTTCGYARTWDALAALADALAEKVPDAGELWGGGVGRHTVPFGADSGSVMAGPG